MLQFDPMYQPYASNRFCVTARNGMVATGSNLAGAAGLEMLKKGGNAVDAAVATAAALTVVEPTSNGLGSDSFALVWMKDRLYGLNSSGYSPRNISLEAVQAQHPDGRMPRLGWTPVMVPGAVKAWPTLLKRFGKLTLKEVFAGASKGNIDLQEIVQQYEEMLGTGIVNIVNMFRPQLILLGGAMSEYAQTMTGPILEMMKRDCFGGEHGMIPEIAAAELGSSAGMIGAANL